MSLDPAQLQDAAKRHLWMHFTRMGDYATHEVPIIVRGDGPWVWDSKGKRYLDALSGLFVVQVGHGRQNSPTPAPARPPNWVTSPCGATPTRAPSSWRSASPN